MAMKMALGADPRPGRVPEQEQSDPRNLSAMAAELCIVFWENPSGVRVFLSGMIYRPKGVARGSPRGTGGRRLRPPLSRRWDLSLGCGSLSRSPFWL